MSVERLNQETTADLLQVALHQARYDLVFEHVKEASSILEIGTGCGLLSQRLSRLPAKYAGVEIDPEAAAQTRSRISGSGEIYEVDARHLPFADAQFSHVVCLEVLEHLGKYRPAIEEIRRCLKPDGKAIISVPYRKKGGPNPGNEFHLYEPGEDELRSAFEEAFTDVGVSYQYFDETWFMTTARRLHIRRFVGLEKQYRQLTEGHPDQLARLHIGPARRGLITNLILVAQKPRHNPMRLD